MQFGPSLITRADYRPRNEILQALERKGRDGETRRRGDAASSGGAHAECTVLTHPHPSSAVHLPRYHLRIRAMRRVVLKGFVPLEEYMK